MRRPPIRCFALQLCLLILVSVTPSSAEPPADLGLTLVAGGLSDPVAIRHAGDGSGRIFIVEQAGIIRIHDGNTLLGTPFLDITGLVDDTANEQGLLGLAFHPDYPTNGYFYVNYTRDPGAGLDRTVVARYSVSVGDANVANAASAVTILEVEQNADNHNGGDIHFGPDGYLYIGMGDGGSRAPAQDLGSLLGKMLRIDVDGTPPAGANDLCGLVTSYAIPAGNPFAGGSGDCDEIWALGLRNPWRWSFDRFTGDLLIGDVGQQSWEEINFRPGSSGGGENYGWSCREGAHDYIGTCLPGPLTEPVLEYAQGAGNCAVTGGFRYRGQVIGGLGGLYAYADYCTGNTWFGTRAANGSWSSGLWSDTPYNVSSFGEDEAGELYLAHIGGAVYRFTSPSSLFTDGFESGDLSTWQLLIP